MTNYGFGKCRCGKDAVVKLNEDAVCLVHFEEGMKDQGEKIALLKSMLVEGGKHETG